MQRGGVDASGRFIFTAAEVDCLTRASEDFDEGEKVVARLHALLDWGLLCGYTEYSVAGLHKWPVRCGRACHFDELYFSRYRKNGKKAAEQIKEFIQHVHNIHTDEAKLCIALAAVTACQIEQKKMHRTVAVCGGVGLLLCLALAVLSSFTLKAAVSMAKRHRRPQTAGAEGS